LSAGLFKDGVQALIGRTVFDGKRVPGRVQTIEPSGIYHPSAWAVNRIVSSDNEYLVNSNFNVFEWVPSQNSQAVNRSVRADGQDTFTIGRVRKGAYTYLGKVSDYTNGIFYEDENDKEVYSANNYEILTCRPLI
jgi:hypothetical protein